MRRNLKNLRLRAIAVVDNPCQEHAKALVIKSAPSLEEMSLATLEPFIKYICENDGAHSFSEVLSENKFSQDVWPCVDALSQSIRSIVGDGSLTGGEREAKISASVEQFLTSVRDISPEVSKQLEPLLVRKRDDPMPKTVEELEKQVGELTGQLTSANALVASEKARADAAEKAKTDAMSDKDKAEAECKTAKAALAAATEEVLKVGEIEVKKSEVGEAQFNLTKGLQSEATMARLEKRATEEFPQVVGTAAEKALVLKAIEGKPEDDPTRKALEAILTAAQKMTAAGFGRIGGQGGVEPTVKAAQGTFDAKVSEIQKRDSIGRSKAMSKARSEFPAEYAAAYPDSAPAEQAAN